jgi:ribonuclease R
VTITPKRSGRDARPRSERHVVEIRKRGRLLVGDPYFTPGLPITIDRRGLGDAHPGDLAVVRTGRGRARVERVLGSADRIETVLDGFLEARGESPEREPYEPSQPFALEDRVDLRGQAAITIDPDTAKDFDDAVCVEAEEGGFRAWVHIADVSHYVRPGLPVDHGATERAVSVYVPGRVSPMLPPALSEDLCSLRPREDRTTVTVEVPFDAQLHIGRTRFYRSVIHSRARLTYGEAQAMLGGEPAADATVGDVVRRANELSTELRRRRFARGALRVESREVVFAFDGRGGVAEARLDAEPQAHALIEELMILANEAVAAFLSERRAETLYRVHEPPDPQSILRLGAALSDLGVPTPPLPDAEAMTPNEASRIAGEISERVRDFVARTGRGRTAFPSLVLRSLKQARYDPANLGHSGLQSPAYCHFTSPIRRYPDLVCHRALLHALGAADVTPPEDVHELAEHTSAREREAEQVEYGADEICLAWYLEQRLFEHGWDHVFEGEVTGLIGSGLFVRFDDVFEGYVPVRTLRDDYYELSELGTSLQGRRGGKRFRLGDVLSVRVEEVRRAEGKIELRLAAR